jgi:hypothetical protein
MDNSEDQDMDLYPVPASKYRFGQKSSNQSGSGFYFKTTGNNLKTSKM